MRLRASRPPIRYFLAVLLIVFVGLLAPSTQASSPDAPDTSADLSWQPGPETQTLAHNERYLIYMPFAGFTNQVMGMYNAFALAALLNRTLILPPPMPSQHEVPPETRQWARVTAARGGFPSWNRMFDMPRLAAQLGVRHVDLDKVRASLPRRLRCSTWTKQLKYWSVGAMRLMHYYNFSVSTRYLPLPPGGAGGPQRTVARLPALAHALSHHEPYDLHEKEGEGGDTHEDEKDGRMLGSAHVLCIANAYKIAVDNSLNRIAAALRFSPRVERAAEAFVQRAFGGEAFVSVHVRRGDKTSYRCSQNLTKCHRSLDQIEAKLKRAVRANGKGGGVDGGGGVGCGVFVATDETEEGQLRAMEQRGWVRYVRHSQPVGLSVFEDAVMDSAILCRGRVVLGDPASTYSGLAMSRASLWYGSRTALLDGY